MKFKAILPFTLLIITTAAALLIACGEPARPAMPIFQVVSLQVTPETVATGEEATVTAQVQNSGNVEGNFQAVLTVDGQKLPAKTIAMPAESTKRISFTLTRDTPGEYELTLGKAYTTLSVKKFVPREIELAYGSGEPRDALYAGANGGHLIDFTPPDKSFILNKLRICGGIYGSGWHGQDFEIFVLDNNYNVITSQVLPITVFPQREVRMYQMPLWREFEMLPTGLADKFYIYVYTDTPRLMGLHIGADASIPNEHSDLASGRPPDLTVLSIPQMYPGQWCNDRNKVNWMIQATGTIKVAE